MLYIYHLFHGFSLGKYPYLGRTPTLEVSMIIFYQPNPYLSRVLK